MTEHDQSTTIDSLLKTFPNDPRIVRLISGNATQSERTSWNRKKEAMESVISQYLDPINGELMVLENIRAQMFSTVQTLSIEDATKYASEKIEPISDEIARLEEVRQPHLDNVRQIREDMVNTCIHPKEMLAVQLDGSYECKFCNKRMKVNSHG